MPNGPIWVPKRTQNRSRSAPGRLRGARGDFGTLPERSRDAPGTLRGCFGTLPDASGTLREAPGAFLGRSWDDPGTPRTTFEASEKARGSRSQHKAAFGWSADRFSTVFRMSCASAQVRFTSVLVGFRASRACCDTRRSERAKRRKNCRFGLENRGPGRPESSPSEPERARTGKLERKNELERAKSSDFLKSGCERGQSERESASCWAGKGAKAPKSPDPRQEFSIEIIGGRFAPRISAW